MKKSDPLYDQYVAIFKARVCDAALTQEYEWSERTWDYEKAHHSCKWRRRSLAEHPRCVCLVNGKKVAGCRLSCKHQSHPSRGGIEDFVLEDL